MGWLFIRFCYVLMTNVHFTIFIRALGGFTVASSESRNIKIHGFGKQNFCRLLVSLVYIFHITVPVNSYGIFY